MESLQVPKSWSELTWRQLLAVWRVKMRYGGNPDVARAAALLKTISPLPRKGEGRADGAMGWRVERYADDPVTGEKRYLLTPSLTGGVRGWAFSPRTLSQMASKALRWFDFPYGDPGEEEQKDEKGKVIKEKREPVRGYVNRIRDWHDALALPKKYIVVRYRHFALPEVACFNFTWEQYRTLQNLASNLFAEGLSDEETLDLQAQFLAHCLTPRSFALLETTGGSVRIRPHWEYSYNAERANGMVGFWEKSLSPDPSPVGEGRWGGRFRWLRRLFHILSPLPWGGAGGGPGGGNALFPICFQSYQTAVVGYYATAYPLLFGGGKSDAMTDALKGEVRTINAVMKYAGYTDQQQVYDSNLPIVLDILNTMAEEARQIEEMNNKLRSKK